MTWSVSPRDLKCLASRALLCLAFTYIFVDAKPCAAGEVVTSPTSPPVPTLATARAELPFEIQSEFANGTAAGVITARLAFSFATVSTALGMPAAWCECAAGSTFVWHDWQSVEELRIRSALLAVPWTS